MQSTLDMTREQWLEERRKGLGGSDAAAILGMNPYKSPLAVYCEKLGLAPEIEDNEAMRQGRDLEEYVARRFCEATGKKVRRCNRILRHPEHPWMLANIDRDVVGEDAGLECKTTSQYNKTPFDQGEVPAVYYWQCVHYMAVTGAAKWYLAVLVHGKAFYKFEILRNEEHINYLTDAEWRFWQNSVLAELPPLPCGSEQDGDLVAMLPGENGPEDVVDLQDLEGDIDLLQVLKRDADALETRIGAIKQRIAVTLSGADAGRTNRWYVTNREQSAGRLDTKRIKADLPEIAAKYTNVTTSRVMRFKEEKS